MTRVSNVNFISRHKVCQIHRPFANKTNFTESVTHSLVTPSCDLKLHKNIVHFILMAKASDFFWRDVILGRIGILRA